MEDIDTRLKAVEADTKEILTLLKSNPDFNKKGYIEKVIDLRKDVNILIKKEEIFHTKVVTITGITMAIVGFIIWIADKIINLLTNK